MSKAVIRKALDPWMRVETWHTAHPLDEERFHRAVAVACKTFGTPLNASDIEDAIMELAKKYHGAFDTYHLYEMMGHYAQEAENLSMFVQNTRDDS
jgi:hypothetical protein